MRYPEVNEQNEEPMGRGKKDGKCEVAPSSNGLDAARKTEEDCGNLAAPAVGEFPTLQAALKQRGPVQPKIKQKGSRGDDPSEKQGTRCSCGSFQLAGGFHHRAMRLKPKQTQRGDEGGPFHKLKPPQPLRSQKLPDW